MKIAIDCSRLNTEKKTGTHRFLIGFLNELSKRDGLELFFYFNYLDKGLADFKFLKKGKVIVLEKSFYTQLTLLGELHKYDYFVFPWQTVPFLSFLTSGNVVAIIHDTGFTFKTKLITFLTQIFSKELYSVSKSTSEKLIKKTNLITEGVDISIFYKIKDLELNNLKRNLSIPEKYLLSVGRIEERKNIFNNLEAFSIVSKFYPTLKYCFVGNFEIDENIIYSYLDKLMIDRDRVVFKNYLSDKELNLVLNSCELVVFTSKEEGFGLPVLESYSVGKWVILSRIQQLAELSLTAKQLVDPNNPKEIAEAIVYFLSNKLKLKKEFNPERILEIHSWKNSVDLFLKGLSHGR